MNQPRKMPVGETGTVQIPCSKKDSLRGGSEATPAETMKFTVFKSVSDTGKGEIYDDWDSFTEALVELSIRKTKREYLPLLKLAEFGNRPNNKGNLRHTDNIKTLYGIEGDYDGEVMPLEEAVNRLQGAGVNCVVYPTWSYTEDKPRWRVLAPLSVPVRYNLDTTHAEMVSRLNGVLGGVLAPESWVLGQNYYFGWQEGVTYPAARVLDGEFIDTLEALEAGAVGQPLASKSQGAERMRGERGAGVTEATFEDWVVCNKRKLRKGDGRREMLLSYIAGKSQSLECDKATLMSLVKGVQVQYFEDFYDDNNLEKIIDWVISRDEDDESASLRRYTSEENIYIGDGEDAVGDGKFVKLRLNDMLESVLTLKRGPAIAFKQNPRCTYTYAEARAMFAGCKTRKGKTFEAFIAHPDRYQASSITFKPGGGFIVRNPDGEECFNIWVERPLPEMDRDEARALVKPFIDHIKWLWGAQADQFIQWLAHLEQQPGDLPDIAWLHIAPNTGMGRNLIATALVRVWPGMTAANFDMRQALASGFNHRLSGKLLAIVDEINEGGTSPDAWAHAEKFKSLINEDTRTINKKNQPEWTEWNACRWLLFSNHDTAIPLHSNDRRVEVARCDETPRSSDYYKELYNLVKSKNFAPAMRVYLSGLDLSGFDPHRHAEMSAAKLSMVRATAGRIGNVLHDLKIHWPLPFITSRQLAGALRDEKTCDLNGGQLMRARSNSLSKMGFVKMGKVKKYGKDHFIYRIRDQFCGDGTGGDVRGWDVHEAWEQLDQTYGEYGVCDELNVNSLIENSD